MPLNFEHKILFIHIPKCAGTSIEHILKMTNKENLYTEQLKLENYNLLPINNFTDEEFRMCASKNPQHYTYRELTKILPIDIVENYKKISIVRNPFDRLVSEYYYREGHVKIHRNFECFVKTSLNLDQYTRNWLYDGHLETQTSFLINKEKNFNSIDKIFNFEDMKSCFKYIQDLTGIKQTAHLRSSSNRISCGKTWEEYYTSELKEIVYSFYKEDFINFNYT